MNNAKHDLKKSTCFKTLSMRIQAVYLDRRAMKQSWVRLLPVNGKCLSDWSDSLSKIFSPSRPGMSLQWCVMLTIRRVDWLTMLLNSVKTQGFIAILQHQRHCTSLAFLFLERQPGNFQARPSFPSVARIPERTLSQEGSRDVRQWR